MNTDEIVSKVFDIVRGILSDSNRHLSPTDDLVRDLRIPSDDLTFLLVPQVEHAFAIRVPVVEWDDVGTIGDVVTLVERHLARPPTQ